MKMKVIIIIVSALALAGCATTHQRTYTCATPVYSHEYDSVNLAPTVGGLQPMAPAQVRHTVRPGETLWGISKAYDVDLDDLVKANSIKDTGSIEKGQILAIPGRARSGPVARAATTTYARSRSAVSFVWPVKGAVLSRFGSTADKVVNKGIDIKANEGSGVAASREGKVVFCDEYLKGFGKTVIIDHMDGYQTVYSYNSDITVRVGDTVRQRDVIAKVGSSGRARVSMLHFEIRRNGEPQNPEFYLTK